MAAPVEAALDLPLHPLAGGLNSTKAPTEINPDETPDCLNVEFNQDDVRTARGSIKLNNQTAPRSGVLTRAPAALPPLSIEAGKSVPLRGYAFFPYRPDTDIGGDFAASGALPGQAFHARRGRSFTLSIGFQLPATERLHGIRNGTNSGATLLPNDANVLQFAALGGFDEALDECTLIAQKGGDRLAPMSWALGIVNTGDRFEYATGAAAADRPSNYALVFMWYDAPEWAGFDVTKMRYKVGTGSQANVGTTGAYCTTALRAIVAKLWIEPGRPYVATVELVLDSGNPGSGADPTATWNGDGSFRIGLIETTSNAITAASTLGTDLFVWKGPADSYDYLTRYGVRFSGRDALFGGLGYRFAPWQSLGWIPFGLDSAALEEGGFALTSVADTAAPSPITLTSDHTSGDAFLVFNHRALINGNTNGGSSPMGLRAAQWLGLGDGAGAIYNTDSLRGYWATIWNQGTSQINGVRVKLGSYSESGGSYRIGGDLTSSTFSWAGKKTSIQAFRWMQRPLVLQDLRIYSGPLNWTDPRTIFSLRASFRSDDQLDPTRQSMIACWPMDDSGGGVLRELIANRRGYLAPFMLGSLEAEDSDGGVFLSGEGEAVCLDLSNDPVFAREFANMLRSPNQGFAIEVKFEMPEAVYAIDLAAGSNFYGQYAPPILSWEVRDPDQSGTNQAIFPLLELTQRCFWATFTTPVRRPMGFMARVATNSDNQAGVWNTIVSNWDGSTFQWDVNAIWVGRTVTMQVGIQSTGTADQYVAYVAFTPRFDLNPTSGGGDASNIEAAYFTIPITIAKKDLLRSVITIGGRLDPENAGQTPLGYSEMNARIILKEVRVFGCSAPGALPATSGLSVGTRDGKLQGQNCLPVGKLSQDDILRPVGFSQLTANVVEGSATVTPAGQARFFAAEARDSIDSVKQTYLIALGDTFESRDQENALQVQDEFYFINSVAADGSNITLATVFRDATRRNASVRSFRLIGYTHFGDDISQKALTLGVGSTFVPGTTKVSDCSFTDDFWINEAPLPENWKLRVYSPIGQASMLEVLPAWTRGVKIARRNPILGLHRHGDVLYAVARGAIFRADDRWRPDGPTDAIKTSLGFLGTLDQAAGVWLPRAQDRVRFPNATNLIVSTASISPGSWVLDAWVWLDDTKGYQTYLWVGSELTNPSALAGSAAGSHKVHLWLRLNNGQPELVLGSTAAFSGSVRPEKGLYVATAQITAQWKHWTHIRWMLGQSNAGAQIALPKCKVNGHTVAVRVNAQQSTYAGSATTWLDASTLVDPGGGAVAILGCARDGYLTPKKYSVFTEGQTSGQHLFANYLQGWTHPLIGKLAGVVASLESAAFFTAAADFDPRSITYASKRFESLNPASFSVGHKVLDTVLGQAGVIYSHPLISLFHEMGGSTDPCSFTSYEQRAFVTNGGRPVYLDGESASFLGVLPPTTKAKYSLERKPLWKENSFSAGVAENDPIADSASGTAPVYHFQSLGNNYWRQAFNSAMSWVKDTYFSFKALVRPYVVSGRSRLYSACDGLASGGPFIDCEDGVLIFGWYDSVLKQEVSMRTNVPVLRPDFVHYIHIRKLHPNSAPSGGGVPAGSGAWRDSMVEQTSTFTLDVMVCRPMMKEAPDATYSNYPAAWAKTDASTRNAVSLTTDLEYSITGATATGLVSSSTRLYNGAGAGVVNAAAGAPFHKDMLGMFWQWQSGANGTTFDGKLYRITAVGSTSQITVVDAQDGSSPNFAGIANKNGGVFTGVRLQKSANFSSSRNPDSASYDQEFFGSHLSRDPLTGIQPFEGEWYSVAWNVTAAVTTGQNADIFESHRTDNIETGSDLFEGPIYTGSTAPNELKAVGGFVFACVNTRPATGATTPVSSQPNEDLQVDVDVESNVVADPVFWQSVEDIGQLDGPTRVRVAFFDPAQNQVSLGGPPLLVQPTGEDRANPSAQARTVLSQIPTSPERKNLQRWVYMTLVNGATYYRVAVLLDNTASSVSVYKSQGQIAGGPTLEFDNAPPPKCKAIATSQDVLIFANLSDQPDGYKYSKPYQPSAVPFANFDLFSGGRSREITALADIKGHLVLWKRDAMRVAVIRDGVMIATEKVPGIGCNAQQSVYLVDNRLYFQSDRGWYMYMGTGLPMFVSPTLETHYRSVLDRTKFALASAGLSRLRDQVHMTVRTLALPFQCERLSSEFDTETTGVVEGRKLLARHRFSRYRWPMLTALGTSEQAGGGVDQLIGGTEEGFVVYLDRDESLRVMLGPDSTLWGAVLAAASAGADAGRIPVSAAPQFDTALEGARGATVEWVAGGVRQTGVVLFADSTAILLDRSVSSPPANTAAVTVGSIESRWETKWSDFEKPQLDKKLRYIDVTYEQKSSGLLTLQILVNRNDTQVVDSVAIDLSQPPPFRFSPSTVGEFKTIKLRVLVAHPNMDVDWSVQGFMVRAAAFAQQ